MVVCSVFRVTSRLARSGIAAQCCGRALYSTEQKGNTLPRYPSNNHCMAYFLYLKLLPDISCALQILEKLAKQ